MRWQTLPSCNRLPTFHRVHHQRCPVLQQQQAQSSCGWTGPVDSRSASSASLLYAQRCHRSVCARAAAAPSAAVPLLQELEILSVLNVQGLILPEVPEGSKASVFAVFDDRRKLQFIGFSKDFRNTLRTLMGRRPERMHFYKAHHLDVLDQNAMIAIRTAWFEEAGGPPPGNKLPNEKKAWQQPVEAGAISERGKLQAAEQQAQEQLTAIKLRGCKEEFIPNPALLQNGQVDFLPTKAMTPEELQQQRDLIESMAKATRTIATVVDGQARTIEMFIKRGFKTNGGYMYDLTITYEEKETEHRVIVGKDYYEENKIEPEQVLERVFAFLMRKRVPRHTEGMLLSSQFPVNYFGISDVEQWFDDFADEFLDTGKVLPGPSKFWRFNKLYNYKDQSSAIFRERARDADGLEIIA